MRQYCIQCNKSPGTQFKPFCECGGITEVEHDLAHSTLHNSPNPYVRFADLLPGKSLRDRLPTNTAYSPVIHATALGKKLGMPWLYLKNESTQPTSSTKDHMAVVSLAFLHECGVRTFCTSSTGNSSTSYAHAIRNHPDMQVYIFTAENFIHRVQHADHSQVTHFGLRDASFVNAFEAAGEYAKTHHLVSESGFFNPGRREGLKLAFFEATEQIPRPIDWYVQAVSSAMGVYGTYKGAKELLQLGRIGRLPKLFIAQQESCAPLVNAYEEDCESIQQRHIVARPTGIAEAILRGNPTRAYPHVRRIVKESGGMAISVSEEEIREARLMIEDLEGLSPCFSSSTAMAGLIKRARKNQFPLTETVMVNLTGGDRTGQAAPTRIRWMKKESNTWKEESPS